MKKVHALQKTRKTVKRGKGSKNAGDPPLGEPACKRVGEPAELP